MFKQKLSRKTPKWAFTNNVISGRTCAAGTQLAKECLPSWKPKPKQFYFKKQNNQKHTPHTQKKKNY